MAIIEQMELVRHRSDILCDVECMVEKYRAMFSLEMPGYDENFADKLILAEFHNALRHVEKELLG